jgi:hypothetical protein
MKTTLNHLHHQHTDWLRELEFYKLELGILTERLAEVASANTAMSVAQQVEHFQNRFILLNEQLDVLRHDVKLKEQALQEEIKTKPSHIDEKISQPTETLLERVSYLFKSIADTRFEFNGFLAKTL